MKESGPRVTLPFNDHFVAAKTRVAIELMSSAISATKEMLEQNFQKPTSYYNGEKGHVLDIARTVYQYSVTNEDVERLARQIPMPEIVDISENVKPSEVSSGEITSSNPGDSEGTSL